MSVPKAENGGPWLGGWRSKLADTTYRSRVYRTAGLSFALFSLGVVSGQRGPALLDLQLITMASVQQASAFLTAGAAGNMAGALLGGFIYDLVSRSLLLLVSLVLMGVMTVVTPFCYNYWLMVTVCFLLSVFGGCVATAGNADVLRTWNGKGRAAVQAIHFCFALGGLLAPFITEPFLAPALTPSPGSLATQRHNSSSAVSPALPTTSTSLSPFSLQLESNHSSGPRPVNPASPPPGSISVYGDEQSNRPNLSLGSFPGGGLSGHNGTSDAVVPQTRVHIAFIIAAVVVFLSAVPFVIELVKKRRLRRREATASTPTTDDDDEKNPLGEEVKGGGEVGHDGEGGSGGRKSKAGPSCRVWLPLAPFVAMLTWVCLLYMLIIAVEGTFPSYLTTYVVLRLRWSKSRGALLTAAYWASFAASRFLCIFLVRVVTPARLLLACFLLVFLALLAFLLCSLCWLDAGVWVACAVAGAAMSPVFPASLTWVDREVLPVTGRVTSAVVISAHVGPMLNPLALGHLMEHRGAIWLAYVMLGETTACSLVFILLFLFTKHWLQKRFSTVTSEGIVVTETLSPLEVTQSFLNSTPKTDTPV